MTTNGQNPKKSSRADARPGGNWTRVGLAVGLTAVAAAAILAGEALRFSRVMAVEAHQIAPGVKIASVPVGGLSPRTARARVRAWAKTQLRNSVTFVAPVSRRRWHIPVAEIGGRFDIDAALTRANQLGRGGTWWDRFIHGRLVYDTTISPTFRLDEKRLDARLDRIGLAVYHRPISARGRLTATGVVEVIAPGQNGVALDQVATKAALLKDGPLTLARGATTLLVVRETRPAINPADLGAIDTSLAGFHTDFGSSSTNRRHNVELAARKIDGTLLAPGATFSYNDVVGPRTPKLGWLEAPTYQDGQVVPGPGGGVCQVSTTLYNAVLRAGLKIVQRSHHSMPVHYVEPGRDATVAYDDIDFKFRNSTDAPLLIAAKATGGILSFSLHGKAPLSPQQIDLASSGHTPTADGGFRVTTYRIIRATDGTVQREPLSTDTYAPPPSKAAPRNPARTLSSARATQPIATRVPPPPRHAALPAAKTTAKPEAASNESALTPA